MAVPSTLPAPGDETADRRLAIQVAVTRAALRELLRLLHRSGAVDLVRYADGLERLAIKCPRDVGKVSEIMVGFGMFYRLLTMQSPAVAAERPMLSPLPRVTPEPRDMLVARIDEEGSEAFTMRAIEDMETDNPELLQMAHNFALRHRDYLGVMQGFALLYQALVAQGAADRTYRQ